MPPIHSRATQKNLRMSGNKWSRKRKRAENSKPQLARLSLLLFTRKRNAVHLESMNTGALARSVLDLSRPSTRFCFSSLSVFVNAGELGGSPWQDAGGKAHGLGELSACWSSMCLHFSFSRPALLPRKWRLQRLRMLSRYAPGRHPTTAATPAESPTTAGIPSVRFVRLHRRSRRCPRPQWVSPTR